MSAGVKRCESFSMIDSDGEEELADWAVSIQICSMMPKSTQGGHSARVNMKLLVNGSSLPMSQMGPDFLLLTETINHPPADASIVMQVDESERRWDVRLPNGISMESKRVVISAVD
jgi:hypothetical protein